MTKLWTKDAQLDAQIEAFTIGDDQVYDMQLAPFDIMGSLAHCKMLSETGLIEKSAYEKIKAALQVLFKEVSAGNFNIEAGVEDIHSQVEIILTQKLGEFGKQLHTARSRNDQVLLDLKLFFRQELLSIKEALEDLFDQLLSLSEKHKGDLMPGYTHTQVAMISSFGLWFGAFAENLCEDMEQLLASFKNVNKNPLGSAAGYGSAFPIKRALVTEYLGFEDLNYNVIHAQMGRGRIELSLSFTISSIAMTLNKMASDCIQFANSNYGFIQLAPSISTGSSIMPHKRNPDVFELIRSKTNQLMTLPSQVNQMCANLTSGYHRDFQDLKPLLFPAIAMLKDCIIIMSKSLTQIKIQEDIIEAPIYDLAFTVEAMHAKVLSGVTYRDAYHQIAEEVKSGSFNYRNKPNHQHEGSIGNLCTSEIMQKMEKIKTQFPMEYIHKKMEQLLSSD